MDYDLVFVIGLCMGVLVFPSIVSAFSRDASPRSAAILVLISGGLMGVATMNKPSGYSFEEIPGVVSSVVTRYVL